MEGSIKTKDIFSLIDNNSLKFFNKSFSSFRKKNELAFILFVFDPLVLPTLVHNTFTTIDLMLEIGYLSDNIREYLEKEFYPKYDEKNGIFYLMYPYCGNIEFGFIELDPDKFTIVSNNSLNLQQIDGSLSHRFLFSNLLEDNSKKRKHTFEFEYCYFMVPLNETRTDIIDNPRITDETCNLYFYLCEKVKESYQNKKLKYCIIQKDILKTFLTQCNTNNNSETFNLETSLEMLVNNDYIYILKENNDEKCFIRDYSRDVYLSEVLFNEKDNQFIELVIDKTYVNLGEFGNYFRVSEIESQGENVILMIKPFNLAITLCIDLKEKSNILLSIYKENFNVYQLKKCINDNNQSFDINHDLLFEARKITTPNYYK